MRSDPLVEVVALCPFTVGTVIWQPQAGAWTLTACVKGTFKLDHGRDVALDERQDAVSDDQYFPDNPRGSLYIPSDLVPFKPRGEVTVVGHAYAPRARPVEALVARLCVGELDKALGVVGNRVWKEGPDGLEPSAPEPFVKMPLRYERATRGPDNPVGLDLAAPPVAGALALPNLEPVEDDSGVGRTVGFGPIAASWAARKNLLGAAQPPSGPESPLPPGFDFAYYNAAPRDQQVDLLRANAKVVLENLHPRHARLETRIPAVRPKAFLVDARGKATEIALRCDTVWIDTDRGMMALTWRGLTGVETGDAASLGTLVVAIETKGKEIRYKLIENLFREGALGSLGTDDLATEERNPMGVRHDSIKPSAPPPPVLAPRSPAERPRPSRDRLRDSRRSSPPAAAAASDAAESTQTDVTTDRIARALRGGSDPPRPSDPPASSAASPATWPRPRDGEAPAASEAERAASGGGAKGTESDAPPRRPPTASTTEVGVDHRAAAATDASDAGEGEADEAYQTERTQRARDVERAPEASGEPAEAAIATEQRDAPDGSAASPAPPPGPTADTGADEPGGGAAAPAEPAAEASPQSAPQQRPPGQGATAKEVTPPLGWRDVSGHEAPESPRVERPRDGRPEDLDLEAYAEICAELAVDGAAREAVLTAHTLDEARWLEVEQRWKSELAAGDDSLRARFASALETSRERLHAADSIRVADFVKVQIAAKNGDARGALAELGLAAGDLPLLRRVWKRRAGIDPEVAKAIADALEPQR
jgi:hypothetical protein